MIISSTPRDDLAEPDNNTTSVTDQLRPTEKAKTGSQNVLKTDEAIVMKSAEPAHQASNDDTAESNYVLYTLDRRSSLFALIVSGASVSIFPSGYANQLYPSSERITGIRNFEIRIDGTTTYGTFL